MKVFLDTEFIEKDGKVDLISIGIVTEYNDKYYAINSDFDRSKASPWVRKNVIDKLEEDISRKPLTTIGLEVYNFLAKCYNSDQYAEPPQVAEELIRSATKDEELFIMTIERMKTYSLYFDLEWWGYFPSYDWVAFCSMYKTMINTGDLGLGWRINDLYQYLDNHVGISGKDVKGSIPQKNEHNALDDAIWIKNVYETFVDND